MTLADGGRRRESRPGLTALVRKQFVRPERSDLPETEALAFRHLLIRDAAYDAIPKATRAELHERFADWLDGAAGSTGEQDEILAYHLEASYRMRIELGPADQRTRGLADAAAARLLTSSGRARDRGDLAAAKLLLERCVEITDGSTLASALRASPRRCWSSTIFVRVPRSRVVLSMLRRRRVIVGSSFVPGSSVLKREG